jgi:hypothetical protein
MSTTKNKFILMFVSSLTHAGEVPHVVVNVFLTPNTPLRFEEKGLITLHLSVGMSVGR